MSAYPGLQFIVQVHDGGEILVPILTFFFLAFFMVTNLGSAKQIFHSDSPVLEEKNGYF